MTYLADEKRYDSMIYRRSGRSGLRLPAGTTSAALIRSRTAGQ